MSARTDHVIFTRLADERKEMTNDQWPTELQTTRSKVEVAPPWSLALGILLAIGPCDIAIKNRAKRRAVGFIGDARIACFSTSRSSASSSSVMPDAANASRTGFSASSVRRASSARSAADSSTCHAIGFRSGAHLGSVQIRALPAFECAAA